MTNMLIGGKLVPAADDRTYDDVSPVTGEVIAQVPDASDADVASAVNAAAAAAKSWRKLPAGERGALVGRLADILESHGDELAQLDSLDGGHPLVSMLQDVDIALEGMRLFAGLGGEIKGETIPASAEHLHYTVREPFGVVAKIIPFNHPLMFAAAKIAAPLVAGNTVVLKPPETAPLSALRMGELFASELPPGVLNIVVGDGPGPGRALVRHPLVRRIGFTGSEATGRAVQRDAAEVGVKDVTLELGGKNAMIAFPDASPSEVARSVVRGMNFVRSAGQSCGSTSRLLLHAAIADAVLDEVVALMAAIKVGDPRDLGTEMGTLATPAQYEKALRYIELGKSEGARLRTGGGRPAGLEDDPGLYVAPTLFDNVRPDMRLAQEEVFGPVLSAITWSAEEEAIDIANSVDYGLTASVWTNDVRRAHRVVRELEAGFVWINGSSAHFTGVPFGGFKLSGLGREENLDELLSYTQIKAVNVMM